MRKAIINLFIVMLLIICSMTFASCEAITAQNITHTSAVPVMNGGHGMKGGPGGNFTHGIGNPNLRKH